MVGSATGGGGHEFALSGNIESNVRFPAAGQGPLSRYPGCSVSQPALPEPYTDDGPPALASGSLVAGDVRFTATRQCPLTWGYWGQGVVFSGAWAILQGLYGIQGLSPFP